MGDIGPFLVVTARVANWWTQRKERKMKDKYEAAKNLLYFRPAEIGDLTRITALEQEGYPADEKASEEALTFRQHQAGNFFLVAILPIKGKDLLVGYTCATLTSSGNLTHDSMARHDPDGTTLCIHSVCVDQNHRRRGIAKRMLQAYVVFVQQTSPQVSNIRLISKEALVPLYKGAGFKVLGKSSIQHGKDEWIEMSLNLQ